MQTHQQRVVDEQKELGDKLDKLSTFFSNPIFATLPVEEQMRLEQQKHFMHGYNEVLKSRIEAF